jgi:hypothetical protein
MHWRAWYIDGQSISSIDSTWKDLESNGLIILKVWPKGQPKSMYCGLDAIWWDGKGRVFQLDVPDPMLKFAKSEAKRGFLKFGKQIDNEDYERIYSEALEAKE